MNKYKYGDKVFYKGKPTHIEEIINDKKVIIANPFWDWDEESECVYLGIDYNIPFWIKVDVSEITL